MMAAFFGLDIPSVEEGGGSVFQAIICAYSISLYFDVDFFYVRPTGIYHREHFGTEADEWDRQWNDLFNLYDGSACQENRIIEETKKIDSIESIPQLSRTYKDTHTNHLFTIDFVGAKAWIDKNISVLVDALDDLCEKYYGSPKPDLYFDSEAISVALHVRRFSKADTDPNPIRDYFHPSQGQGSYYHRMMCIIESILGEGQKPIHYHIYSQGDFRDFESFLKIPSISSARVFIHTDESPFEAIHHMANADIFVMAKSSLSWVAMIYARGKTIGRKGFWHKALPSVLVVDQKRLNKSKIGRYILGQETSSWKTIPLWLFGVLKR